VDLGDDEGAEQRVAAELEEVVVNAIRSKPRTSCQMPTSSRSTAERGERRRRRAAAARAGIGEGR